MAEKKSFVMYFDMEKQFEMLSDAKAGKLIKALMKYARCKEIPAFHDGMLEMAFSFISTQIDRDSEKYAETCRKRSEYGKKGGAPKGNTNASKHLKKQAKQADTDIDNDIDIDTDTDTDIDIDNDTDTDEISGEVSPEPPLILEDHISKSSKKKTLKTVIENYTQNQELVSALLDFSEMRSKMKKPLTIRALKLSLDQLDQIAGSEQEKIACVDQSVQRGWQTFYPIQNNHQKGDMTNAGIKPDPRHPKPF